MRVLRFALGLLFVLGAVAGLSATPAPAATITIVNVDGAGEGFNDPTVVAPVGGNPGTTIGQQRLNVFQEAANVWGSLLPSSVVIRVRAQFNPQSCTATSGVLGSAGPVNIVRDFPNAPFSSTWYHVALGNRLAATDLVPASDDINATFNSSVGSPTCLTVGWYYGFDHNEGTQIDLLPVVLHELGHGLGFSTPTSGSSGAFNSGFPGVYDKFLLDKNSGLHWDAETAAQRVASAIGCNKLVWDGANVVGASAGVLGPLPLLRVNAPVPGDYPVGQAAFGTPLTTSGLTGNVVLADDGTAPDLNDACEPIVNGAALAGNIALVNRGTCTFVIKVKACQDAGAIAVIVADNAAGCPPGDLGGSDPTITIPAVRVTQADGVTLKAMIPGGLNVTLLKDPALRAGADAANRVLLYTPSTFAGGSSVSHWDVTANPNLLMEPAINSDLTSNVDLTLQHFTDIGWFDGPVPALAAVGNVHASATGVHIEWVSSSALTRSWTVYRRETNGDWMSLGTPATYGEDLLIAEDSAVRPGAAYAYRLGSVGNDGKEEFSPDVWVTVPGSALSLQFANTTQNPSSGRLMLAFSLPSDAPARLTVTNVAGRVVHAADLLDHQAGSHVLTVGADSRLSPGVYFVRLSQGTNSVQRSAVVLNP